MHVRAADDQFAQLGDNVQMKVRAFCSVWVLLLYPSPSPSLSTLPLPACLCFSLRCLSLPLCLLFLFGRALDVLVSHARNVGGGAHGGQGAGLH